MLGSGARAAQVAARRGSADALAAEHLAVDALANRWPPDELYRSFLSWADKNCVF
jgi:hypothetical protein